MSGNGIQGQQGGPGPNMMVPDLNAWGVSDVTAQMGMQVGRSAVAAGQEYIDKHVRLLAPIFIIRALMPIFNFVIR